MVVDPKEGQSAETSFEEEGYYAEVEKHFVGLRGSPLFTTPKDWQLVHNWRQMQIPLRVVKDGLSLAFERPRTSRPIRHLSYCRQTVEGAYRRYREALAGVRCEGEAGEEEPHIRRYLVRLEGELRDSSRSLGASRSGLAELATRSADRLGYLCGLPMSMESFQEIEAELDRVDAELVAAAETCLEETESRRCMEAAERSLEAYRARMPDEIYSSAVRSAYLKRVRAHFGLPALSLFYI
jgi:hypothetical protein